MSKQNPIIEERSLARFKHVDVARLVMRETYGNDERNGKQLAEAKGIGNATDAIVQLAVVQYDDTKVELQPFAAFDDWNSRTRAFAFALWKKINAITEVERKKMLQRSKPSADGRSYIFDLSGFANVDCKSFGLRETNGADERAAAARGASSGEGSLAELVLGSFVSVDGQPVGDEPFEPYGSTWNSRTRAFVLAAWQSINSLDSSEIDDFLSGETEISPPGSPS